MTCEAIRSSNSYCWRNGGFTYLGMIIFIAVLSMAALATLQLGAVAQRRAAEEDLLAIGTEFRNALISYANTTPPGQSRSPKSLEDLLKDPRLPGTKRHLRKLYADPITGNAMWGIVTAVDGSGIVGVYSLSDARPIKIDMFPPPFQHFAGRASYRDWRFVIVPVAGVPMPAQGRADLPPHTVEDAGRRV